MQPTKLGCNTLAIHLLTSNIVAMLCQYSYTKDTIRGQSAGQKHANCAKGVLSQNPLQAIMKRGDTSSMKIENTTKAVIKI